MGCDAGTRVLHRTQRPMWVTLRAQNALSETIAMTIL